MAATVGVLEEIMRVDVTVTRTVRGPDGTTIGADRDIMSELLGWMKVEDCESSTGKDTAGAPLPDVTTG